ncbi:MAG: M23 family metallopeptidase [Dysgonamonadaceae bacterium]|jgi:lipoprotein NlpD|nr:M23 family metallopeptidase [Dysgonamonadaceae bacterium]
MKKRSAFWQQVRFKYKLLFLNENTLEEVFSLRLSQWSGFWILLAFAFLLITLTSIVIINTPIRNYLPGYMDSEIRQEMIANALKTDSLEHVLSIQTQYLKNVTDILKGESSIAEVPQLDTTSVKMGGSLEKSKELEKFVRNYEEEERYNLNVLTASSILPSNLLFYRPVQGIVSAKFSNAEKHYGVDVAALPRSSVLATMKGTVVFSGFDANGGYVIQIQHTNGFLSVYKHNALLLKKQADEVSAGEAIAIVGNTGSLSSGTHLHFELWYNGRPVDPEEFIVF